MKTKKNMPGRHVSEIGLKYGKDKPDHFYFTGIKALDEFSGGLPSGEMTIIGARPGDGKTALGMQIVEHIGLHHAEPSGVFSIEMPGRALVTRMIAARTGIPSVLLRKNELTDKQRTARDVAIGDIVKLPLYIDDASSATIPYVERVSDLWLKGGVKILVLDYIQLMSSRYHAGETRSSFIGEAARAIKTIAKKNNVPFLVLCQLNRESSKNKRRPTLADLRESGDLEQVADNVILIHPDVEMKPNVDLILAKWRNGPTGVISTQFDSSRTRFESIDPDADEPRPFKKRREKK